MDDDLPHYSVLILGFCIVFSLKHYYFQAQPHDPDHHAMRFSVSSARLFSLSHMFLGASLIGTGVGLKLLLLHADYSRASTPDLNLLCYSLSIVLISTNMIRLSHPFRKRYTLGVAVALNHMGPVPVPVPVPVPCLQCCCLLFLATSFTVSSRVVCVCVCVCM